MQKNYPAVSVILPIYCVEKYLEQCIDSILVQTCSDLEIILVNDGSTDHCGNICDKYSAKDSRIRVIHKKNGGVSSARNVGLDIAVGEYIAFIDPDDTVHPRYIEILLDLCQRYDCDIAQCDFLAIAEDSVKLPFGQRQRIDILNNRQALSKLCSANEEVRYVVPWGKIYKRDLFDNIRYPIGRIHEDEFTTYLLFWKARKIVITNQYLYYYIQRATSIMWQKFSISRLDVLDALRERAEFLKNHDFGSEYNITLRGMIYLISKFCSLLKEDVEEEIRIKNILLVEKERLEKLIPIVKENIIDSMSVKEIISKDCSNLKGLKIVLYGAGNWGKKYYQWIKNNHQGIIVGWVDNLWFGLDNDKYSIKPLDFLKRSTYDCVFITIKSRDIQEQVRSNLIGWGIPEYKIRAISTEK